MPRTLALVAIAAAFVAAPLHAQIPDRPESQTPGPIGPFISPVVDSLSAPDIRKLDGGTLTMVHAPARLHVGTAYIALFVDDAQDEPDADADLSCYLYPPGEAQRGVRAFAWRADPGRFLLREITCREGHARELAVRVIRPGREDAVEYFTLEIGSAPESDWQPGFRMYGPPGLMYQGAQSAAIPGGRVLMLCRPSPARVGPLHFEFFVQTAGREEISLSAILLRAGIGDFYDTLSVRRQGNGHFVGAARAPQPGLYILQVTCVTPDGFAHVARFDLRVTE
ncbi:MAG: hypothetical protein GF393_07570 [Armatimonadia bacterium]|nr:hypothetical protein [Armatimonadia bacterium]